MNDPDPIVPDNAPVRPEQAAQLNSLLSGMDSGQLLWLEGFVGGLRAGLRAPASASTSPLARPELLVLYGTESGNAESLADQTVKAARKRGFDAKAVNMADMKLAKLKDAANLLVLVSTWGEGDPPETAVAFHEAFMSDQAPRLENTRFSVLSLGDTGYEHFCKIGKDFDARLEALGARRIFDRKDCDVDFDEDFAAWHIGALKAFEELNAPGAPTAAVAVPSAPSLWLSEMVEGAPTAVPAFPSASAAPAAVAYSRKNPFPAELKERALLNGEGSAKETIHLEFNLEGSGLSYETGDALGVVPRNAEEVVEGVLQVSRLDADSPVSLKAGEFSLREALTSQLDITTLSKVVLNRYKEMAQSDQMEALIQDQTKLADYIGGRDLADLLRDFPVKALTAQALTAILRKMPPRLYSIASSPKAHPGEAHLTVGVVRYDAHGRKRKGVCSTYLAERIGEGDKAGVFISPNKNFKAPANPDTPIIMVGPGTGIAPFRAFVEERKATDAKGKNWLIFGDQRYLTDFLYQSEWQDYLADGVLTRIDVAFSRDQKEKIYVQDRMRENAKELYAWLQEGAHFYVCGDASRMAPDVDKALRDIVAQAGGLSEGAAAAYVKQLKSEKRYLRDVY